VVADVWAVAVRDLALDMQLVTPIPAAGVTCWRVDKASEALVMQALAHSGCHRDPRWAAATTYTPGGITTPPPLMPLIGKAHLAAEVLNGRLDGRIISGPHGQQVVLLTNMGKQVIAATIETAERERGVVAKSQEIDNPLLGVLDLASGETSYYQGDAVFTFLDDWLPILASQILSLRQPRYDLNNAEDWMLQVAVQIGTDKQLPRAAHPGLADPQIHRVNAMFLALAHKRRVAIQGQPGTGKTHMIIALMAQNAYYWQSLRREEVAAAEEEAQTLTAWRALPRDEQTKATLQTLRKQHRTPKTMLGKKQPAWVQPFKVAWRSNRRVGPSLPHALHCPRRSPHPSASPPPGSVRSVAPGPRPKSWSSKTTPTSLAGWNAAQSAPPRR
jgi:hypothetical protein